MDQTTFSMAEVCQKRPLMHALLLVLLLVLTPFEPVFAGDENGGTQHDKNPFSGYKGPDKTTDGTDGADRSVIFPAVWCGDIVGDEQAKSTCWKAYRAGLSYYEWGVEHRKRVLWWQHMSTRAIFFVVLFLVGAGIYFAWVQFRAAPASGATSELEISMQGVKVSSPILGVIILTLSLAFFYLYLIYVYPVQEVI